MEKGSLLNDRLKAVRSQLRSMAPAVSIPYIQSFQLPEEEELALIEGDARGRSVPQGAMALHVSYETGKRRRRSALLKISRT